MALIRPRGERSYWPLPLTTSGAFPGDKMQDRKPLRRPAHELSDEDREKLARLITIYADAEGDRLYAVARGADTETRDRYGRRVVRAIDDLREFGVPL